MKKINKYFLSLLTVTTLTFTGCGNQATTEQKDTTTTQQTEANNPETTDVEISIKDTVNDKEILTEDAKIDENGLKDYLEKNHKAVFEDGMMTELEGIKQDEKEDQYWMYYVNDEMADVGIGDYVPKAGDEIEFRFEKM
ncbi:DUF4430 domain-containing protein [Anaerococcus sp.]|uniref:DUF4430 domain-containing protein n=1 Tax=Anaerococcus sp. TaxID=1872515 RepID=UPI002579D1F6|nr:DUF4430 domain-containing protein [Anaerococcus sp.]MBS6106777.1 DUF4430 domain-containing protein [Anaerococcus sp.]